jgi:hypothetical protein
VQAYDSTPASQFADKFVAYIDILGFKALVAGAEAGGAMTLDRLLELQDNLGEKGRLNCCPQSERRQANLDFCVS